ncbi:hypothetical protein ACFWSF_17100 [Streptomyces sp. NPDC058611]|uniref:hypothetical protein n=1 Tax=unclassified Streptomyces TaxID=2593676 RepID=UPI0036586E4C
MLRIQMDHADGIVAQRVWARLGAMDPTDPDDVEWLSIAAERFAVQVDEGVTHPGAIEVGRS